MCEGTNNIQNNEIWTKVENKTTEPILVGRVISKKWLSENVRITQVHLKRKLRVALEDLWSLAKHENKNLPVSSLFNLLQFRLQNLIYLDTDLGLKSYNGRTNPAIKCFTTQDIEDLREIVLTTLKDWVNNHLAPWSEKFGFGEKITQIKKSLSADDIDDSMETNAPLSANGKYDFPLIARSIAEFLIGEMLFDGMRPVELVPTPLSTERQRNVIELMTPPMRGNQKDTFFSMVARLTISTVPYSNQLYININPMKRVWAKSLPTNGASTNRRATGYVLGPDRCFIRITTIRDPEGWQFDNGYDALLFESRNQLPDSLKVAVSQREYNPDIGWWTGFPETTALYNHISQHSTFESDEIELMETVGQLLSPIVEDEPIAINRIRLPRFSQKPLLEVLKQTDLASYAAAGSIFSADYDDANEDEDKSIDEGGDIPRLEKIIAFCDQNQTALQKVHGDNKPVVVLYGGRPEEQTRIEAIVDLLFGDAVDFYRESLPLGTHGLKKDLDLKDSRPIERFEDRVKHWQPACNVLIENYRGRPIIALICAQQFVESKPEDRVNYYAGIHAFSVIGANVHHVLPLEDQNDSKKVDNFNYRVQSALLDVLLAHTGVTFGVKQFIERVFPIKEQIPKAIYGIQVVRSQPQAFSGQKPVNFILYSKTIIETGITYIRIVYCKKNRSKKTDWIPLQEGLAWLGSQRSLHDGDKRWLERNFCKETKVVLAEINDDDPKAIVMIDWPSVASLWKGISDAELSKNSHPSLDDLSLSRLKEMTFIRLRRGADTLTLRTLTRTRFEWVDTKQVIEEPTGEFYTESYGTTTKSMVSISQEGNDQEDVRGHYITTMTYPKTVQLLRGQSCYKTGTRMIKIYDDSGPGQYEKTKINPATKNASLPASMDVTVMQCPGAMPPYLYAAITMGLRVGYAHYDSWTALPMPLFYRSKVEDYIMRYPETEEWVNLTDKGNDTSREQDFQSGISILRDISDEVERKPDFAIVQEAHNIKPVDTSGLSDEELLGKAKKASTPALELIDFKRRLIYQRMISSAIEGKPSVTLTLPPWAQNLESLFPQPQNARKAVFRRCWKRMIQDGFVPKSTNMFRFDRFMYKLASLLNVPQGAFRLVTFLRLITSNITFQPMVSIINDSINPALDEDNKINPSLMNNDDIELIAHWANQNKHDELTGWLIFMVAQFPRDEWVETIFEIIDSIPGSRTRQALIYYLETDKVIKEILTLNHYTIKEAIHHKIPEFLSEEITTEQSPIQSTYNTHKEHSPGTLSIMKIKKQIVSLIDSIDPGTSSFDSTFEEIQNQLILLQSIHKDRTKQAELEQSIREAIEKKKKALKTRQTDLLNRIIGFSELFEIPNVIANSIIEGQIDTAIKELDDIENLTLGLEKLSQDIEKHEDIEKSSSFLQRKILREEADKLYEKVSVLTPHFISSIDQSICFTLDSINVSNLPSDQNDISNLTFDQGELIPEVDTKTEQNENIIGLKTTESADAQLNELATTEVVKDASKNDKINNKRGVGRNQNAADIDLCEEPECNTPFLLTSEYVSHVKTLIALYEHRLFGLGEIHLYAMNKTLESSSNKELLSHQVVLSTINRTLEAIECDASFEFKTDKKIIELLQDKGNIEIGKLSDSIHFGLGLLSAGISNILFNKDNETWIIPESAEPYLGSIVVFSQLAKHLQKVRNYGLLLTRNLFSQSDAGDKRNMERERKRLQDRAKSWKDSESINSSFSSRPYQAVHESMFSPQSEIGRCLQHIANGDDVKAKIAFTSAKSFKKPAQTVDKLFKDAKIRGSKKAEGPYRVMLIENVELTQHFIEEYFLYLDNMKSDSLGVTPEIRHFLSSLYKQLHAAIEEIKGLQWRTEIEKFYQITAERTFRCVLSLYGSEELPYCVPSNKQKLLIDLSLNSNLMPVLDPIDSLTPSLYTPEVVFERTRQLADEPPSLDPTDNENEVDKLLIGLNNNRIQSKEFLPAFVAQELLISEGTLPHSNSTLQGAFIIERDKFNNQLQQERQKVTHAMSLGALDQVESQLMLQHIEELLRLNDSDNERGIGKPNCESISYPDFPQARFALKQHVEIPLVKKLTSKKMAMEDELTTLEEKGIGKKNDYIRIRSMLEINNAASLRTASDAISMLNQNNKLPETLETQVDLAKKYDDFISNIKASVGTSKPLLNLVDEALRKEYNEGETPDWIDRLSLPEREQSLTLINTWIRFFDHHNPMDEPLSNKLFSLMGFTSLPSHLPDPSRRDRALFLIDNKVFQVPVSDDDHLFIPPALGSLATDIQCFVLYGNNVQPLAIKQLVQEVSNTPTLILTRSTMNMDKRAETVANGPVLLIDDNLIVYSALNPGDILHHILHIGILTFKINPYDDYGSLPVPSEMFFGRKQELDKLRNVKSFSMLYGGRRLGKTSLLSQIEKEFDNERNQRSVFFTIQNVDKSAYVLSAWEMLLAALITNKVIQRPSSQLSKWQDYQNHIQSELVNDSTLKSLVLLIDEADNLMDCELKKTQGEIGFVQTLIQMVENLRQSCNIRIVMAGLHNMARMSKEENTSFGKLDPIDLKPFSNSEEDIKRGIRLITKPLYALGYIFAKGHEDLPYRILSICNFYPAFIQLYCKRLVEQLQNNRQSKAPPYEITDNVLDAVEKDHNLLTDLSEKFNLNLNLDKRYKAIALILADNYYNEIESGDYQGLSTSEIREYCETYADNLFTDIGTGVYEALLDEMVKLTVLERNRSTSKYMLRNAKIAVMIGNHEDVNLKLNELAQQVPETSRNSAERRAVLKRRDNTDITFPMPSGWVRNHVEVTDNELLILAGNTKSGIMELSRQAKKDGNSLYNVPYCPVPGRGHQALANWVNQERRNKSSKIYMIQSNAWEAKDIPVYAQITQKAAKYNIRVMMLACPLRALEITQALEDNLITHGEKSRHPWRVVPIPPWSLDAIHYQFEENSTLADNEEAMKAIQTSTFGFGCYIEELSLSNMKPNMANDSIMKRRKLLEMDPTNFYNDIGLPKKLISDSVKRQELEDLLVLINGIDRGNLAEQDEYLKEFKISREMMDYAHWMGLLQEGSKAQWVVPQLYLETLTKMIED
ncbi:MAG: RNaseH domain-containing protein [Candidatus Thiodiazotropha taylori]|nr:RNaseH domain-containing protein [Candidatus Thiodiazotropha taylori]